MSQPAVRVEVTRYAVTTWPAEYDDSTNKSEFVITVEYRGRGKWAVLHRGFCIGRRNQRQWERLSSSRTERFLKAYRFDLEEAMKIAKRAALTVKCNGLSVTDVLAWEAARVKKEEMP